MKTKEFNLSEKIVDLTGKDVDFLVSTDFVLDVEDVQEFIRLLKKGIHNYNETSLGDEGRNEFINKLAGDKLK